MPPERRAFLGVFAGVALVYLSLSPFTIATMGYAAEEEAACRQVLSGTPIVWPRHGAVGLVFQCPFVALGRAVAGPSEWWDDRFLSVQPVLASALLVALTYAWCRRLSGIARWSFLLALAMAFGTMIWPYAYIGLETTQSLFLLAAGFLALASDEPPSWPRTIAFGVCAAVAVSAKANGAMLLPVAGYLLYEYVRPRSGKPTPARASKIAVVILLVGSVFAANAHARSLFWQTRGGLSATVDAVWTRDALGALLHFVAFLGSPNKGLIVFAPLAILALFAAPRALAANRRTAIFALLTFACLAGGSSLLEVWTDETWGPRYLHACVAPLVLCLAAARGARTESRGFRTTLLAAAVLGFGVSFLGVLFHYGRVARAAVETAPVELEEFQGNPLWNHVRFNARLLRVWLAMRAGAAKEPVLVERGLPWNYRVPVRAPERRPFDLRTIAVPQPLVLRALGGADPPVKAAAIPACAGFLFAGLAILLRTGRSLPPASTA